MARWLAGKRKPAARLPFPAGAGGRRRVAGKWAGRSYGIVALALVLALMLAMGSRQLDGPPAQVVALWQPSETAATMTARSFSICSTGARVDCIVDGDTFWISGQKVRIADINTPEISSPACRRERELGEQAKRRLHQLMNAGPVELRRSGRDRDQYGRLLRTVHRDGRSLGEVLVAEGLAHRWNGRKESWCG